MSKKLFLSTTLTLALSILATGAGASEGVPGAAFISRFSDLENSDAWFRSDFTIQNEGFRTAWKRSLITQNPDGAVTLSLAPAPEDDDKDFFGAEIQRTSRTHFGEYEVVMTAARGEGVISSFFTYTGPHFEQPHDEIDFEFLGRDTTKVWLNRFIDGEKLPGRWIDLEFDAADGPHTYRLEWLPDRLVWYVDGTELMRVTEADADIPQIPQRIYLNIWAGGPGQQNWSGEAPLGTTAAAQYFCVSYRPPGSEAPMCSDDPMPQERGDE